MSIVEIAPGVVIPDKVTPENGWRVWRTERKHGRLCPVHISSSPWKARQPAEAVCHATRQPPRAWIPVSLEEAIESQDVTHRDWFKQRKARKDIGARPPRTFLPRNMAYVWRAIPDVHEPPMKDCTCGIYATTEAGGCADQLTYGAVLGRVALWGKTVPGDRGWRSQYAYPTELFVVPGKRYEASMNMWTAALFSTRQNDAELASDHARELAEALADNYAVPCSVLDDWRELT